MPPATQPAAKELPLIQDKLQTVCATVVDNELRAKELYVGKRLAAAVTFHSLQDALSSYKVIFIDKWKEQSDILISGHTKDKKDKYAVLSLSKGKSYSIIGTVYMISASNYGSCLISLTDIEFPR